MDDYFKKFWTELEKEGLFGIDEAKFQKVISLILKEQNLTAASFEETEGADILVTCRDRLDKDAKALVRIDDDTAGIDKAEVEDLYNDMADQNGVYAIFFSRAYYTKEARDFSAQLPVKLVDRRELSDLLYQVDAARAQKAFVSDIDDRSVKSHFQGKLRNRLTRIILGIPDKVESIDRRYLPFGFFAMRKIGEKTESTKYAYIDLTNGDLFYVDEGGLTRNYSIRKLLELPKESRELLIQLIRHGDLPQSQVQGKYLTILEKEGFASSSYKGGEGVFDMVLKELTSLTSFVVAELGEFAGMRRGDYPDTSLRQGEKYARASLKLPSMDKAYDLENYLEVENTKEGFDADEIRYPAEDVASLLREVTGFEVEFKHPIYFPYYVCKYTGPQGTRYERHYSPKFKPFFPKRSNYGTVYRAIDRFPELPYVLLGAIYVGMNLDDVPGLLHVFSASFLFVVLTLIIGIALKAVFKTERVTPFYGTKDYGVPAFKYGFPSLHSMASVGAASFTYFIDPPETGMILSAILFLLAAVYIYSRLRIGAHSRTDVLGGGIIGFVLGIASGIVLLDTIVLPEIIQWMFAIVIIIALVVSIVARLNR